jgi:hypothetical protein
MPSSFANYKACLQKRPIITKSITCAFLFVVGDYIAQKGMHFHIQYKMECTKIGTKRDLLTLPLLELPTMDPLCIYGIVKYCQNLPTDILKIRQNYTE